VNNQEAKEVLLLYRPGLTAPDDPEFVDALECTRNDPELAQWFREHCAIHDVLRARLRQIPVPEGLKEQILSERRAYAAQPIRRRTVVAALCSVALVLLVGTAIWFARPASEVTFDNFHNRMLRTVAGQYPKMDLKTSDLGKIRQTLAEKKGPADFVLPSGLAKTISTGCAVLEWQGKPVSMICFNSGRNQDPNEPDLFLFVVSREYAAHAPINPTPEFSQRSRFVTASWSRGDRIYVLATAGDETFLKNYL